MKVVYDLGNIADWLSAIGTVSAVIVALYLAHKDRRPRAKVSAGFVYPVDMYTGLQREPLYISVEIVNQSLIPIYLSECTLLVKRKERMAFLDGHHNVNKLINPGEVYKHKLDYEQIKSYYADEGKRKVRTFVYFKDAYGKKYKTKVMFNFLRRHQ